MKTSDSISFEQVADILLKAKEIAICGHVNPDGDCIGSELGIALALEAAGKKVDRLLAHDDPVPPNLEFLPGADKLIPAVQFDGSPDLFLTVDVPTKDRLSDAAQVHTKTPRTLTIDHHQKEVPLSQDNYVDPDAPATCQIVWKLLPYLKVQPSKDMATCLLTGLMTDTGRFQFQNTTAECLDDAADMVRAGAYPAYICTHVFQSKSLSSLLLQNCMVNHIEFLGEKKDIAFSWLSADDFKKTNATKDDAETLIGVLRSIRGVRIACIIREQADGVRGSLRAKDDTDVSVLARKVGGGGHKAAAGFSFNGTLQQACAYFRTELPRLEA